VKVAEGVGGAGKVFISVALMQWGTTILQDYLRPIALRASKLLLQHRPNLCFLLGEDGVAMWGKEFPYSIFPLFMVAEGCANMHRDRNDLVSLLFLIRSEPGRKGGLELGGLDIAFKWEQGDVVVVDSRALEPSTRDYKGVFGERLVGIFILHLSFLQLMGVSREKLYNLGYEEEEEREGEEVLDVESLLGEESESDMDDCAEDDCNTKDDYNPVPSDYFSDDDSDSEFWPLRGEINS
jgi:hypothetical protein